MNRMNDSSIRRQFDEDDSGRQESLERARLCAALTKPWVLPPDGWSEDQKLPETFSSLASRGVTNLEGRLLLALFPPGVPWFRLEPHSKYQFDPTVDPKLIQQFKDKLHLHEMIVLSKLENADNTRGSNARRAGFRSRQRTAISQLLITGDVLTHLTDDYTIRVFRRDNYVTKRDDSGNVLYHIIKEKVDPLILTPQQMLSCELNIEELMAKNVEQRMEEMYTQVSWQPQTKSWVVEQECRKKIITTSQEPVTPFFSTPFELPPAANYGRGLIESNLGDVRSMNELTERVLDYAAVASKHVFALDYNSQVRPQDLARPTGSVIQARVQGGQVQDVGMLRADKLSDFNVVNVVRENIRKDLATVMLMEGETTPRGERVTAYQVQRVAMELEGSLGGVYAPIADSMQVPLVDRLLYQLRESKELPDLPDDSVSIQAVTGVAALTRESDQAKLLQLLQSAAQLGPEAMSRFNMGNLLNLLVRQSGVVEPGIVKTDDQIKEEQEAAKAAAMQEQVQGQMLQSAGKIAETQGPEALGGMLGEQTQGTSQ